MRESQTELFCAQGPEPVACLVRRAGAVFLGLLLLVDNSWAGGAVAQTTPGVRVHEKARVHIPQPGVWPTPIPESSPTPLPKASPSPGPAPRAAKPAKVLVSSPYSPSGEGRSARTAGEISVEESLTQLLMMLDRSSEMWLEINDRRYKMLVVTRYVERYSRQGVRIKKPAEEYVNSIDEMASADARLLSRPFKEVLKMVAVLEYDFGNGEDPEALALRYLGEKAYRENKKRFQRPPGQVHQAR